MDFNLRQLSSIEIINYLESIYKTSSEYRKKLVQELTVWEGKHVIDLKENETIPEVAVSISAITLVFEEAISVLKAHNDFSIPQKLLTECEVWQKLEDRVSIQLGVSKCFFSIKGLEDSCADVATAQRYFKQEIAENKVDIERISMLLSRGAEPTEEDLTSALNADKIDLVECLLGHGIRWEINPNIPFNRWCHLCEKSKYKRLIIESLIRWNIEKNAVYDKKPDPRVEDVDLFPNVANPTSDKCELEFYKELVRSGYKVTLQVLKNTIWCHNYDLFNFLLKEVPLNEKYQLVMLQEIKVVQNPKLNEILLRYYPKIFTSFSEKELKLEDGIKEGYGDFVILCLKNGLEISDDGLKKFLSLALQSYQLGLIRFLCEYGEKKKFKVETYPKILHLESLSQKNLKELLLKYVIFSPLKEFYDIAALYPQLFLFIPDIMEVCLLVRFPNSIFARDINSEFADKNEYIKSSKDYILGNREFIKEVLPTLKDFKSHKDLLDKIWKNRFKRLKNSDIGYELDRFSFASTPLLDHETIEIGEKTEYVSTGITRYNWSLRHLNSLLYHEESRISNQSLLPSIVAKDQKVTFLDKNFLMTTICADSKFHESPLYWYHTDIGLVKGFSKHILTKLEKEIFSYTLDISDPKNRMTFFQKVALVYFYYSTLCEKTRGTPHNAMIWLNLVYEHHRLPPPVPRCEHFFLDNTMLMRFPEKAIEEWDSYFEPTFDENLPKDILERLLQRNGLLLKYCSEKTRCYESLVSIAIKQNKEALAYAALPLRKKFS